MSEPLFPPYSLVLQEDGTAVVTLEDEGDEREMERAVILIAIAKLLEDPASFKTIAEYMVK